jgi:Na+-driven multidrug efflux pump
MPSDKEMRVWLIAILVLVWVGIGWAIADELFWYPQGTPEEVIHQLARKARVQSYGVMVVGIVGMLMGTRVAYGLLRAPGQGGDQ